MHPPRCLCCCLQAADMVMHPSPGHYSGTLVNALLHHCGLPPMRVATADAAPLSLLGDGAAGGEGGEGGGEGGSPDEEESELEESDEDSSSLLLLAADQPLVVQAGPRGVGAYSSSSGAAIRPGIVHRLDKGTTGLLVVAKDDATHLSLAAQFKDRAVQVRALTSPGAPTVLMAVQFAKVHAMISCPAILNPTH